MTLSQRLREAEYDRRLAAGLPVDHLRTSAPPPAEAAAQARLDLSEPDAPVIDLTRARPARDAIVTPVPERHDAAPSRSDATTGAPGTASSDEGTGAAITAASVGQRSRIECPQCGGPTQIDLVDAVNQTVSLSCLSCFHMFRMDNTFA